MFFRMFAACPRAAVERVCPTAQCVGLLASCHSAVYTVGSMVSCSAACSTRHHLWGRYESEQAKAENVPKEELRVPRYMLPADASPDYPGGAKQVSCALCPIKRGAFKQTAGPKKMWVHVVCALWQQPEMSVPRVDECAIVRTASLALLPPPGTADCSLRQMENSNRKAPSPRGHAGASFVRAGAAVFR